MACTPVRAFPFGATNVPGATPVGHAGRLLIPIRIGARMNPCVLNDASSPGPLLIAFGFGVPVKLPIAAIGGTPTPDPGGADSAAGGGAAAGVGSGVTVALADGGGGKSGASVAPPPGVDGCAPTVTAKVMAPDPTSTAIARADKPTLADALRFSAETTIECSFPQARATVSSVPIFN